MFIVTGVAILLAGAVGSFGRSLQLVLLAVAITCCIAVTFVIFAVALNASFRFVERLLHAFARWIGRLFADRGSES